MKKINKNFYKIDLPKPNAYNPAANHRRRRIYLKYVPCNIQIT